MITSEEAKALILYTLSLLDPTEAMELQRELARLFFSASIAERDTLVPPSKPVAHVDIVTRRNPKDPR